MGEKRITTRFFPAAPSRPLLRPTTTGFFLRANERLCAVEWSSSAAASIGQLTLTGRPRVSAASRPMR